MAWEQRGSRNYYYRKRRLGDQVVSEYIGAGELAGHAAALDALERQLRRAERKAWQSRRSFDAQIDELCDLISALASATLLAAGYHRHKGQWRRNRPRSATEEKRHV
jgi:nucleotide-binding universal stress UspA family protein